MSWWKLWNSKETRVEPTGLNATSPSKKPGPEGVVAVRALEKPIEAGAAVRASQKLTDATGQSLKDALIAATSGSNARNWEDYDGSIDGFGGQFRYPRDWIRGVQNDYLVFQPNFARRVLEGNVPRVTPCMTFYRLQSNELAGNELLEAWLENRKSVAGFVLHTAEKFILDGMPALVLRHDYKRQSGIWSAIVTLRVDGQTAYYFDAAGLKTDMEGRDNSFVPVLAGLRAP